MAQRGRPPKSTAKTTTTARKTTKTTKAAPKKATAAKAKKPAMASQPATPVMPVEPTRNGFRIRKWQVFTLLGILIVAGALAFAAVTYKHSRDDVKRLSNPTEAAQQEVKDLTRKIGKVAVIPTGETPTLATVKDVSKLKNQVFFQNAQNGDKVLIFSKAKRAVLYRPSSQKIVEIAPLTDTSSSSSTSATSGDAAQ